MGKIFYVMGKSASGKDTIYKRLLEELPQLKQIVLYTTRPIRAGEIDGVEYNFTTEAELMNLRETGKVVEERVYHTTVGDWYYFTVDDGQINLYNNENYLMIGTLESYEKTRDFYGRDALTPIYVEVEDGKRLNRAIEREGKQTNPNYEEICRRFLADVEDFSETNLLRCGIDDKYINDDLEECIIEIINNCIRKKDESK